VIGFRNGAVLFAALLSAASTTFARLQADPAFEAQLELARAEMANQD